MSHLKKKIAKKSTKEQITIKDGTYDISDNNDIPDVETKDGDIITFYKTSKMVDINVIYKVMRTQGPIRRIIVNKGKISVEFVHRITVEITRP